MVVKLRLFHKVIVIYLETFGWWFFVLEKDGRNLLDRENNTNVEV